LKNCNSQLFPPDTIIITARGTVGNIVLTGCPMTMNQSCFALRDNRELLNYYLFQLLKITVERFKKIANGATFLAITTKTFKELKVITPDLQLVKNYNAKVSPLFSLIKKLQQKNQVLQETRDLLLPRLISGKLDVGDLEIAE